MTPYWISGGLNVGFKKIKFIAVILIIVTFFLYIYNTRLLKDIEIEKLETQIELLQKQISDYTNEESKKTQKNTVMFLREGYFDIELYSSYSKFTDKNGMLSIQKPAFGPICKLNRYAIENTNGVKILNQEDGFLTRVSIEGVIPTWVLEESNEAYEYNSDQKQMYVIKESVLTLTPEKGSVEVNRFHIGKAVKVIDSYEEWLYVNAYQEYDSNELYKGWIKSDALGYYSDLESNIGIEVLVKKGFEPEWVFEFSDGLWGEISNENEETYTLLIYGASDFEIEKDNVEPFFEMDQ